MSSTRIWLVCAAVTAAVVGAVLFAGGRPGSEGTLPSPRPPPPLTEQEIRTYLVVWPRLQEIFGRIAHEFGTTRRPGQEDDPVLGEKAQAQVEAYLEGQHLTWEAWQALSKRVERAVNIVRSGIQFENERPAIQAKIELNKDVLKSMPGKDERRPAVEKEIADAEALIARGPPPIAENDRILIQRYWAALDERVPTVGPPKRE